MTVTAVATKRSHRSESGGAEEAEAMVEVLVINDDETFD